MSAPSLSLNDTLKQRLAADPDLIEWLHGEPVEGICCQDPEHPEREWISPGLMRRLGYGPGEIPDPVPSIFSLAHPHDRTGLSGAVDGAVLAP